jgi:hypothetical protein
VPQQTPKDLLRPVYHWAIRRHRLRRVELYRDPRSPELVELFSALLCAPEPVFVGRIGGSDYELARDRLVDRHAFEAPERFSWALDQARSLNGYFDLDSRYETFDRYLAWLTDCYRRADCLTYAGAYLIGRFRLNGFERRDMKMLDLVCHGKKLIDYTFIEALSPFLRSFSTWGEGRRILVVSPLSRSVAHQSRRLDDLILGYRFPSFELLTYTTPITYSSESDSAASLNVTTQSWHEECERMANEIAALEFDVALLSCGSYGMALGDFVRHELGRKAVYLGGMLNVMFNIYGERYDTAFFDGLVNLDTRIDALENDELVSVRGGRGVQNEAMRAYFGRAPRR